MNTNKKISIIIPVYNVEKYLDRCIKSVINQTYKNLEIILIDDGSSDKSGDICDKYSKIDSRIISIHQENMGLSGARNTGLDVATGAFVGFVDSDDWIAPNMYELLINTAEQYNTDIVSSKYVLVTNENEYINNKNSLSIEVYNDDDKLKYYLRNSLSATSLEIPVCTKLYNRNLFKEIRFPIGKIYEDIYTNYLLFSKAKQIAVINEVCYFYFQNKNSITKSQFQKKNLDLITACNQIIDAVVLESDSELLSLAITFKCKNYLSLLIKLVNVKEESDLKKKLSKYIKENKEHWEDSLVSKKYKIMLYLASYSLILFKIVVLLFYNHYSSNR